MVRLGEAVSSKFAIYAIGVYVVIPLLISVTASIILFKFFFRSSSQGKNAQEKFPSFFLWVAIIIYCSIFGTMSILRYLSFHTTFFDLGIYDHAIWNIAKRGDLSYLYWGHFRPIVGIYSFFYRLFPSAITLLVLQTLAIGLSAVPLYYIAKDKLGHGFYGLVIVIIFFLYSPVEYNNLENFHADHLIILFMFLGFYFLEKDKPFTFLLVCLPGLFLKEPLILSISMMGFYAVVRHRMYKSGTFVFVGSLLFFFLVINVIMPGLTGIDNGEGFKRSFSYLGNNVFEIVKTTLFHPGLIVKELINVWKLAYLAFIFVPLLFIPLISPLSLLPALPALTISLLSRLPNHYWIQYHYTAAVIPGLFISLIYGLKFLGDRAGHLSVWFKKLVWINLSKDRVLKTSVCTILIVCLYYNVVLSPSPISVFFWKKRVWQQASNRYYRNFYVIEKRDRILDNTVREFISREASVSLQNSVNSSYLAHREDYYSFPHKIDEVDYVVLDQKRAHYVMDKLDEEEYEKEFDKLMKSHQIIFSYDGIYIFKRVK